MTNEDTATRLHGIARTLATENKRVKPILYRGAPACQPRKLKIRRKCDNFRRGHREGNLDVIDELVADDTVAHSNLEPEPVHRDAEEERNERLRDAYERATIPRFKRALTVSKICDREYSYLL